MSRLKFVLVEVEKEQRVPWIGVDLDKTLAHYEDSADFVEIGEPIEAMVTKVKDKIKQGVKVKIFTARAENPDEIPKVKEFCKKNGLGDLEVTNQKDFACIEIWDDKAIQVIPNTGKFVGEK